MNSPSKSPKVKSAKTRSRSRRRRAGNVSGVPQILLGQKTIAELKILARLASSQERHASSGEPRLKKAA